MTDCNNFLLNRSLTFTYGSFPRSVIPAKYFHTPCKEVLSLRVYAHIFVFRSFIFILWMHSWQISKLIIFLLKKKKYFCFVDGFF